jgi:DNA-binding PadR family transcriptional regulator
MSYTIEKLLDIVQEQAETAAYLVDAMLSTYHESYRKLLMMDRRKRLPKNDKRWSTLYRERQKYYNLLNYLKREGFVESKKMNGKNVLKISEKGVRKLDALKSKIVNSKKNIRYEKNKLRGLVIIAFDIPEAKRSERAWLREVLRYLDFDMVQKSVWIGKCEIPEELLGDLRKREILDYIDIFEVGKSGTLRRLQEDIGKNS